MEIRLDLPGKGFYFALEKLSDNKIMLVRVIDYDRDAEIAPGKITYIAEDADEEYRMGKQEILDPLFQGFKFIKLYPEGKNDLITRLKNKEITEEELKIIFPQGAEEAINEIKEAINK